MSGNIAFIGGGNMASAIAGGLVDSGFAATRLRIAEPSASARELLTARLPGATIGADNDGIAAGADTLVLAVKPQVLPFVCRGLSTTVQKHRPLVISIAAGVRSDDIDRWLGGGLAVVRVMPNQPALLQKGVSGLYANARVTAADRRRATEILSAVGSVVTVADENHIDIVTAVSGSGPAYFYLLADFLEKAAVDLGLEAAAARTLARETAIGAAALLEQAAETGDSIETLIARVRSPNGTTAAALDALEQRDARAIFAAAIRAARHRAVQLADEAHDDTAG